MADYLKIPEVAQLLGLSEKTVRRRVKAGEIPSVFIGGVYRIGRADLDEYLESAKVRPGKVQAPALPVQPPLNGFEAERRELSVPEPTDEQKAAEHNYATEWIRLLELSVDVDNALLDQADISLDEVLEVSEQSFHLWTICWSHEPSILPWCDEAKRNAWEQVGEKLEDLFKRIDGLIEKKRKAEQEQLDQTTLVRLEDWQTKKSERLRVRAAG